MGTMIIVAVLILMIVYAFRGSLKHFKGEGGCCGGEASTTRVKKQKLAQTAAVKRIVIEGMSCEHCKQTVENCLNSLNQVNATVHLRKKEAVVKLGTAVCDEVLKEAVEKAGYQVVSITNLD